MSPAIEAIYGDDKEAKGAAYVRHEKVLLTVGRARSGSSRANAIFGIHNVLLQEEDSQGDGGADDGDTQRAQAKALGADEAHKVEKTDQKLAGQAEPKKFFWQNMVVYFITGLPSAVILYIAVAAGVTGLEAFIEPVVASAATAPPMSEIPMKVASREAPMMTPVVKSPRARPIRGATTMGRVRHCQDNSISTLVTRKYTIAQASAADAMDIQNSSSASPPVWLWP